MIISPCMLTLPTRAQSTHYMKLDMSCVMYYRCKKLLESYDKANGENVYIGGYQLGRVMALLVILILCQITVSV